MTNLDDLQAKFHGELVAPDSAGYDQARRVWNGAIDQYRRSLPGAAGLPT